MYAKYLILLAAFVASSQASMMKDMAVEFSQLLAEHLGHSMDEITNLKETAVGNIKNEYRNTMMKLAKTTDQKTTEATKNCPPHVQDQVKKNIGESVTDRFLHCINFTDSITKLELYLYNISQQVEGVEQGVCSFITNMTSCSQKDILKEINCVTTDLLAYIDDFKQHSSSMTVYIDQINEIITGMIQQFLKCFTNVDAFTEVELKTSVPDYCKSN